MRQTRLVFVGVLLVTCVAWLAPGLAEDKADKAKDEAAIKQIGKDFETAWNKRDVEALSALIAEDADYVSVRGPKGWAKNRARFKEVHELVFKTLFTESVLTTKETHVRFLRPDIAIAHMIWTSKGDKVPHIKHGEPREGIFTWVVEKKGGKWLIVASQNTEVIPPLPGQPLPGQ